MALTPCAPWPGPVNERTGYGYGFVEGRQLQAHRIAWAGVYGPIPSGLVVDHMCHNQDASCSGGPTCQHRRCVNVEHLRLTTIGENVSAGRNHYAARTHCKNGHEFTPSNTRMSDTARRCRSCEAERWERRKQRKKAAA